MQITLAYVSEQPGRRAKMSGVDQLVEEYVTRSRPWAEVGVKAYGTEARLLEAVELAARRTRPVLCLLDSKGAYLSSEQFAAQIARWRDSGQQHVFCCIGPADGWSAAARERADIVLSLGKMTFAHGVARVVLAEQVYRGLSILAGHPYHTGH